MFESAGYSNVVLNDEEINLNHIRKKDSWIPSLPWFIVALLLLLLVEDLWQHDAMSGNRHDLGTYEKGFETDIG